MIFFNRVNLTFVAGVAVVRRNWLLVTLTVKGIKDVACLSSGCESVRRALEYFGSSRSGYFRQPL